MKTNQLMEVDFKHGVLEIEHLTMMGDLHQLFAIGNAYRHSKGCKIITVDKYTVAQSSKELIEAVSNRIGYPSIKTTKGRSGTIKAHLYILLDAAMYLDAEFKLDVIERFVNDKLLQWRDKSGDEYIELNAQLLLSSNNILGKPSHNGHYINLAKSIRSRTLPEGHLGWNYANASQLRERARIEEMLSFCLKNGFVKDWDHLKELAGKV